MVCMNKLIFMASHSIILPPPCIKSILIIFIVLGPDFNHESSIPQSFTFLLLCWHDLPRLHVLRMDRARPVSREGNTNKAKKGRGG